VSTSNAAVEVFDVTCAALRATGPRVERPRVEGKSNRFSANAFRAEAARPDLLSEPTRPPTNYPDNPFEVVEAYQMGTYCEELDLDFDGQIDMTDVKMAVIRFGAGTVDYFMGGDAGPRGGPRDAGHPFDVPPHMHSHEAPLPQYEFICSRCHMNDGLPEGGMLTSAGQENLCLSCHSASGLARGMVIDNIDKANSHPRGIPAAQGDSTGPAAGADSEMEFHLDGGDIRCGTCHNPHEQTQGTPYLRASLQGANLCGECHREKAAEWSLAGHADDTADPWSHYDWTEPGRAACRKCHSGNGFIDFSKGMADADQSGEFRVLDCAVCHGVHGESDPELLRVYDDVTLPGDYVVSDAGPNASCMTCHNGRRTPGGYSATPHYLLGGVMLEGINGAEFGATIPSSPHTVLAGCVDCHMAPSPAEGNPGAGKVGGHTFNMTVHDAADPDYGFENVENSCNALACHGATAGGRSPVLLLTEFNRTAFGDYDGDGAIEGVQDEVQGLLDLVFTEIAAAGAVSLGGYPYWDFSGVVDDPPGFLQTVRDAVWNYEYVDNDGSLGIHNTGYAVGLLQVTYKALTGGDVPGAFLRYDAETFPLSNTNVEITLVNDGTPAEVAGSFTVNFTIEDDDGAAIDIADLNRLRLYVSGPTTNYQRVIYSDSDPTHFAQNPDGSYTYTAGDPFPSVYLAPLNDSPFYGLADGELTGQAIVEGTYTVLIESRVSYGSIRKAGDATLDFVVADDPLSPPALDPRQFVLRDSCNACHLDLQIHGGNRFAITGCVMCHTAGAEDKITDPVTTVGRTIMFKDMIHRIHSGHDLRNVAATANGADPYLYEIIGYGSSVHDFSEVGFPRMPDAVMACDACHGGAAQEAEIYTNITRAACGSCHDDVDFLAGTILDQSHASVDDGLLTEADLSDPTYRTTIGGGVMPGGLASDAACFACHQAGSVIPNTDVVDVHRHATDPAAEGTRPTIEILSVGGMTGGGGTYFQAGDLFEATFVLRNDTTDPLLLVSGDSEVIDRIAFIVSGPTTLNQRIIDRQRPWRNGDLDVPQANFLDNGDGTYTFISEDPFPTDYPVQMHTSAVDAEQDFSFAGGWGHQYSEVGRPLDAGTYTIVAFGRRTTSGGREPIQTVTFDVPFGSDDPLVPYRYTATSEKCNACHGTLAFHGNGREGVLSCITCHAAGAGTGESTDFRIMVHKLHNARNLTDPYILGGDDLSHLLISSMPGEAAECAVCHVNDDWKSPPQRDNMRTWMVVCTSCHDSAETALHVQAATIPGTFIESCAACHGEPAAFSVEAVHASP